MVKYDSDTNKKNFMDHSLFFISSKRSFICTIPDRIIHTTTFLTPVGEQWLEQVIIQWVHLEGSIRRCPVSRINTLLLSYIPLLKS